MSYSKTTWENNVTPVSAANMNHAETQYDEAMAKMNSVTFVSYSGEGTRVLDTVYQNTSGRPVWVMVSASRGANIGIRALIGDANPPTSEVSRTYTATTPQGSGCLSFLVPPSWYYKVVSVGSAVKGVWSEWTLH
jgi:acetaldehyde dehydrogenase (acetylating)